MAANKTILFFPMNSVGHINSSLAIADRLKQDYNYRTVFMTLGPTHDKAIEGHGHELIVLDEASPYEDFELSETDDPDVELDVEAKLRAGKVRRPFLGCHKFPQVVARSLKTMRAPPEEALKQVSHWIKTHVAQEIIDNHETCTAALADIKPDLVIVDALCAPPCIQKLANTPWVRLQSANPIILTQPAAEHQIKPPSMMGATIKTKKERARLAAEEPEKWQALLDEWKAQCDLMGQAMGEAMVPLREFIKDEGCLPKDPHQMSADSEELNIYMFPEALDYDRDDDLFLYPKRWLRCDSLMRQPVGEVESSELNDWRQSINQGLAGKEALVFFSLGSIASANTKLMRRHIEMLKGDERRLYVISKGANGDMYELDEPNMIGGNYIPQPYLLSRANLAIVHGGNNSITECMYYGVPMIVLPVFGDQPDNAQRIQDCGFGRRLDVFNCTKAELQGAISDILADTSIADRMRAIAKKMQARDEIGKVSFMLHKLAQEKHLEEAFIDKCRVKSLDELKSS